MVNNCMKQKIELTGYDILDLMNALDIWIEHIEIKETRKEISALKRKLKKQYNTNEVY